MIHTYTIKRSIRASNQPRFGAIQADAIESAMTFFGVANSDSLSVQVSAVTDACMQNMEVTVIVTYDEDLDIEEDDVNDEQDNKGWRSLAVTKPSRTLHGIPVY